MLHPAQLPVHQIQTLHYLNRLTCLKKIAAKLIESNERSEVQKEEESENCLLR
jgi:hypothetical protein